MHKGYEGERSFAKQLRDALPSNTIVLYDLLLKYRNSLFQIDCLIISRGTLHLIETKNHEGDYIYKDNNFYLLEQKKRIHNPLHQLQRCVGMLQEFLDDHDVDYSIQTYLLFTNLAFTIYEAPVSANIVYPPQIQRFLKRLNAEFAKPDPADRQLAAFLQKNHIAHNIFEYQPEYNPALLKKGLYCLRCAGFLQKKSRKTMHCLQCRATETFDSAVMRTMMEFVLLFPGERITSRKIFIWSGGVVPHRRITSIMKKYMRAVGNTSARWYKFNN